jgi:hypothetical protein
VKVISVNIVDFNLGEGNDYIYKGTAAFIGLHNHRPLKLNPKQAEFIKLKLWKKSFLNIILFVLIILMILLNIAWIN